MYLCKFKYIYIYTHTIKLPPAKYPALCWILSSVKAPENWSDVLKLLLAGRERPCLWMCLKMLGFTVFFPQVQYLDWKQMMTYIDIRINHGILGTPYLQINSYGKVYKIIIISNRHEPSHQDLGSPGSCQ